jgi:hypothetical protein
VPEGHRNATNASAFADFRRVTLLAVACALVAMMTLRVVAAATN